MGIKRKAIEIEVPNENQNQSDILKITPLGAGNEVGRSCILIEYKGKTIMLDCGIHPAYTGLSSLPFFDEIDPSEIDIVLITHFHLDHAASLPYFLEKTTFKGRVFMTHPTKAIYKWLISDYTRVSNVVVDDILYDEKDIMNSCDKIETVDYHQEVEIEGIKFTGYNAGHVLGAAMFLIEIAGIKLLYTGDYSREEDRHLMAAEKPTNVYTDIMICESTYGVQSLEPRLEREARFTKTIKEIVQRGGRCLIPVFALGRAQEILLILDEFWQENYDLHSIPIYYASSLAKKCMAIYQTYINMMNAKIRKQYKVSNPFIFKHISYLKNMEHFDDVGPCVMMASPGMLQNGLSRELLEMWCIDKRNGVVIPGYVVEGTLGKTILSEPDEIVSVTGAKLPRKLSVHYISFSAHVDYTQNSRFIDLINPSHLVLVHGDANEMGRLRSALQSKYAEKEHPMQIYTPKNCETIELYFKGKKQAKVIGEMAKNEPKNNERLSGILVSKDFHYHIMDSKELSEFTDVNTTEIIQKQKLSFHGTFSLVIFHLEQMFGEIKILDTESILVFNTVTVKSIPGKSQLQIEWKSDNTGDMIADSVLAVLLQIEGSPASVRMTESISLKKKKMEVEKDLYSESLSTDSLKSNMEDSIKSEDDLSSIKKEEQNIKKEEQNIKKEEQNIKKEEQNIKKEESVKDSIKHEVMDIKKEIKSEDVIMEVKKEMIKEEDKMDTDKIKTESIDAMDVDEPIKTNNKESKEDKKNEEKEKLKEYNNNDESLSDQARKVMFHNIMDNNHVSIEDDMEFELYMYKFLCMQFGIENVTSENMSLPIMLDYFGGEGVTYNTYDNKTSKLTMKVNSNATENKDDKSDNKTTNSNKKLWKICSDDHYCTIDRKTLEINSTNDDLRKRVLNVVSRVKKILRPLSETWNDLLNNNSDSEISEEEEDDEENDEKESKDEKDDNDDNDDDN